MDEIKNSGTNTGVLANNIFGDVRLISSESIRKIPSLLPKVIEKIAEAYIGDSGEIDYSVPKEFKIDEKIAYNNVRKFKGLISEYGTYYGICENALNAIDDTKPNSKTRILKAINNMYVSVKSSLVSDSPDELKIIKDNSDSILEYIRVTIEKKIRSGFDKESIVEEDLGPTVHIFICYAFAECKILERPVL